MKNIAFIHDCCAHQRRVKWQADNVTTVILAGDFVRIALSEGDEIEHIWVQVTNTLGDCMAGTLANIPVHSKLKYGDVVNFQRHDIEQHTKT